MSECTFDWIQNHFIDFTDKLESLNIKPLLQNSIIQHKETQYRINRHIIGENHCYVFVCISGPYKKPFVKSPSYVMNAIKENKITVIKLWNF